MSTRAKFTKASFDKARHEAKQPHAAKKERAPTPFRIPKISVADGSLSPVAHAFAWLAKTLRLFQVGGRRWARIEAGMFTRGGFLEVAPFDAQLVKRKPTCKGFRTAPLRKERRAAHFAS